MVRLRHLIFMVQRGEESRFYVAANMQEAIQVDFDAYVAEIEDARPGTDVQWLDEQYNAELNEVALIGVLENPPSEVQHDGD